MELKILQDEKNVFEVELVGETHTLANFLRKVLLTIKDVEFASYRQEHPVVSNPVLKIQTKSGKAKKAFQQAIDEAQKEIKDLRDKVKKLK